MSESPLKRLARDLGPRARDLLLADSDRLEEENARTREFLDAFRIPNPIRTTYADRNVWERLKLDPTGLGDADPEKLEALHFFPSGVYRAPGGSYERWIGPDGFVVLQLDRGRNERAFIVLFDDDHGVWMMDDVDDGLRAALPNVRLLVNGDDLVDDYGRILEAAAETMRDTGARPLFRFRDPDLDLAALDYYHRHQVALRQVAEWQTQKAGSWIQEKLHSARDRFEEYASTKGMEQFRELGEWSEATGDGVVHACTECGAKNRIAFVRLAQTARCAKCKEPLKPTDFPIDAASTRGARTFLKESPVPLLVDFWAPWCGPCLIGMRFVIEAADQSEARFAILRVNTEQFEELAGEYDIRALPTMARFVDGRETGRALGAKKTDAIVAFGADNVVPESPNIDG